MLPHLDLVPPSTRQAEECERDEPKLLGSSAPMMALRKQIERLARTNVRVLITGESGVGKEIVARTIHRTGIRRNHIFEPLNCAALPESLLESELFGYAKGSFTGAYHDKPGKLESAHLGTLFLDEIAEMTLRMQTMLLRFLETGEIERVGGVGPGRHVDVRLIAATNRNLHDLVEQGTFREDLFYRLNVVHIRVPPLRERREDIAELANHFVTRLAPIHGSSVKAITPEAMDALTNFGWPGNVRQLENAIESLLVSVETECITLDDLPAELRNPTALIQKQERRHSIADELYDRIRTKQESFWAVVYPMFMNREITRDHVRQVVGLALGESRGNYRIATRLLNMDAGDYKRFLNFLREHDCHVSFKEFRIP